MEDVITRIRTRDFRSLAEHEICPGPDWNFLIGPNAQGKTSLLEAVAVLLRLQSPRTSRLADVIRIGARGLVVEGSMGVQRLQFYYGHHRKKLALNGVEQRASEDYLSVGRAVFVATDDIRLVRGPAEDRRKFLDYLGIQTEPGYRAVLRAYTHALRSRNRLLKNPSVSRREIEAYDGPLAEQGTRLHDFRASLVGKLAPTFVEMAGRIAGDSGAVHGHPFPVADALLPGGSASSPDSIPTRSGQESDLPMNMQPLPGIGFEPGSGADLAGELRGGLDEDRRTGQTRSGPHRDDLALTLDGRAAAAFASEGQQRTLVLALRLAEMALVQEGSGLAPVLLLDDVFGELDPARRRALLEVLPARSQKFVTGTDFSWLRDLPSGKIFRVSNGRLAEEIHLLEGQPPA